MVDFLGIGAQKAGTTWLFYQLSRHPQIAFPCGKELHYWNHVGARHAESAAQWIQMLEVPQTTSASGLPIRTGEITPAYAILPIDVIRSLYQACPDLRLFISLRNPLERAWSAAMMDLARAQVSLDEVSDLWFIKHFNSLESLQRGDYLSCIQKWQTVFPAEQLLILFHEQIATAPAQLLKQLAGHLQIDPSPFSSFSADDLAQMIVPFISGVSPNYINRQGGPIRPSLFKPLLDIYLNQIDQLQSYLCIELSNWKNISCFQSFETRQQRQEVRAERRLFD